MEREKQRRGFGWETAFDIYDAIERMIETGDLTYRHDRAQGLHQFHWYVGGRAGLHYVEVIDDSTLTRRPAAEIAYQFVVTGKLTFQRLAKEFNAAKADPRQTHPALAARPANPATSAAV